MEKILFISQQQKQVQKYTEIFAKKPYEFLAFTDESNIVKEFETSKVDVIIFDDKFPNIKTLIKNLKSFTNDTTFILLTGNNRIEPEFSKNIHTFLTEDMSDNLILSAINIALRSKHSLEQLSETNKNLADSLYRLNVLYSTSSQFAGTLDKQKLINYMIEGLDKSLSFDLTCTLCVEEEPVLVLSSLYEISDELLDAIKLRTISNFKSLFENKSLPFEIDANTLKIIKNVKYPAKRFTFSLFDYDNMFAPINLGEKFFGCIEIFKEASFTADDATYFRTIAQQVSLPLKSATLYQEIKETNKKLEKLERLKSEFISIVSHELRTPLTSIKNSLDILTSGTCGELNKNGSTFLSMAHRNVDRLARIINDLLDLSKIEAGKMAYNFANIDINNVIDFVKNSLTGKASEENITLITDKCEDLPQIYADDKRLEQILTNIVYNAIKFTPQNKTVTIHSRLQNASQIEVNPSFKPLISKLQGDYIVVCVEDEGIGIAEGDLVKVFDKFAQIENSLSRKVGGSGLGLPIAKQMVEAHNGAIWCDSELNKGSKFYFAIPVATVGEKIKQPILN